jgi:hypothetical protein
MYVRESTLRLTSQKYTERPCIGLLNDAAAVLDAGREAEGTPVGSSAQAHAQASANTTAMQRGVIIMILAPCECED